MAENTGLHIGENSPEHVAFKLMELVARVERRTMLGYKQDQLNDGWSEADRKWILDTYNECIEAAKGFRDKPTRWPSEPEKR
jgi:hypothetical protein